MIAFFNSWGRPPKDKKNRKPCYAIGCIIVSVGTHALGKDAAYNAEKGAGPQSPNPFPSVPGSLIILYRPNRVTVPEMQSLPQTAAREPVTCGAGARVLQTPELQVYHRLRRGNQSRAAREPVSRKFPKFKFTTDCGAGTSHMRRGNPCPASSRNASLPQTAAREPVT